MHKSILSLAILSALSLSSLASAEEAVVAQEAAAPAKEAEPSWSVSTNVGFVSDYYTRGVSQSWHKPALQGGVDLMHSSGFYTGIWGSSITPNTFPDASTEIDIYAGYNGQISAVEGLGFTVGAIGYIYPGGSWNKYQFLTDTDGLSGAGNKKGGRWDTYEANFGLSYKWLSAKASVTLSDWFGAEKATGWDGSTKGSTYIELNAAYPLPWYGLTLIGHVGRLNVSGKLSGDPAFDGANLNASGMLVENNPDYTDYKVGLSKSFSILKSDGWNAGIYYVGATNGGNSGYWGPNGYGGASFNGSSETKDLTDDRFVVSISRSM